MFGRGLKLELPKMHYSYARRPARTMLFGCMSRLHRRFHLYPSGMCCHILLCIRSYFYQRLFVWPSSPPLVYIINMLLVAYRIFLGEFIYNLEVHSNISNDNHPALLQIEFPAETVFAP